MPDESTPEIDRLRREALLPVQFPATYAHYRRARAVLAAVLPLVQQHVRNEDDLAIAMWGAGVVLPPVDQDEPPAEAPMFREGGLRHGAVRPFRSADAPQENPWRGPSAGHNGDAPVEFYAWQDGFAAGSSAERARLAEALRERAKREIAWHDAFLAAAAADYIESAALSEGTPDKEVTDA